MSFEGLKISAEDVRIRLLKYKDTVITGRQFELLDQVLIGLPIDEISEELGVKRNTVIQHFHAIKKKLIPFVFEDRLVASLLALGLNDNHLWLTEEVETVKCPECEFVNEAGNCSIDEEPNDCKTFKLK